MHLAIATIASLASLAAAAKLSIPGFYPGSGGFYPGSGSMLTTPPETVSPFAHLGRYIDLSRLTPTPADHLTLMTGVFDPTTKKLLPMSVGVTKSGDTYYIPVCSMESVTGIAGSGTRMQEAEGCQHAIPMNMLPEEVAMVKYRLMRALMNGSSRVSHMRHPVSMPAWMTGPLPDEIAGPDTTITSASKMV
ncbi:hypothetical protein FBU59_007241 [Linderina macrospora]|uniref:Uncharacterized protein n=1 Tax=Linderina macrospora TaxID=4868 RepID=A0ACC1IXL3_9FUNG|nr:hypothetical protein FBU59_007241 [Linderina macrospora]